MEMKKREIPILFYVSILIFAIAAVFDYFFPNEHDVKPTKASLPGTYVEDEVILTFKHDGTVVGIGKFDRLIGAFSKGVEYPLGRPDMVKAPLHCLEVFAKAVLNGRCEKSIGSYVDPTYVMYGVYEMDEHHVYFDDVGRFANTFPCVDITWRAIEDTTIPEYLGEPKMLRVHGYDQKKKKYYLLNLGGGWHEKYYPIVPEHK